MATPKQRWPYDRPWAKPGYREKLARQGLTADYSTDKVLKAMKRQDAAVERIRAEHRDDNAEFDADAFDAQDAAEAEAIQANRAKLVGQLAEHGHHDAVAALAAAVERVQNAEARVRAIKSWGAEYGAALDEFIVASAESRALVARLAQLVKEG
jgi:hypothetical protein